MDQFFFRMKTSDEHLSAVLLQGQVQRQPYQKIYLDTVFFFDVQYPQIKTRNLELYLSACLSVSHNSFRITFHNF